MLNSWVPLGDKNTLITYLKEVNDVINLLDARIRQLNAAVGKRRRKSKRRKSKRRKSKRRKSSRKH